MKKQTIFNSRKNLPSGNKIFTIRVKRKTFFQIGIFLTISKILSKEQHNRMTNSKILSKTEKMGIKRLNNKKRKNSSFLAENIFSKRRGGREIIDQFFVLYYHVPVTLKLTRLCYTNAIYELKNKIKSSLFIYSLICQ